MRRKRPTKPSAQAMPMFAPGTHTLELGSMLGMLRKHARQWMYSVNADNSSFGDLGYFDALNAAELGQWDAPRIESITLPELSSASDDMRYFYDYTGAQLDVAAYCSGEPEYWQDAEPIYKPAGRIIRLAVEIGGFGGVSPIELRNRGEAIIALINSLELQGHSIEVTVIRAYETSEDSKRYTYLIPIKHAGQALDIKRLQFFIGHPAFYRRLLFGLSELAHGRNLLEYSTRTIRSIAPDGFVHIPYNHGLSYNASDSLDWAKQFAQSLTETKN